MKQVRGYWLPDNDQHFKAHLKKDYQEDVFKKAMKYVEHTGCYLDIGAHCGLWAVQAQKAGFNRIIAFEPYFENFECLEKNAPGIECYNKAVGNGESVKLIRHKQFNSGAISCKEGEGEEYRPTMRLDDLDLPTIDMMKIDTEGHELPVVSGAERMIKRDKPIVIVEQRQEFKPVVELLVSWGVTAVKRIRHDYVCIWQ